MRGLQFQTLVVGKPPISELEDRSQLRIGDARWIIGRFACRNGILVSRDGQTV